MIKAVLFDVIGTTVLERSPDIVQQAFHRAFADSGVRVGSEEIQSIRGMNKDTAIKHVLNVHGFSPSLSTDIQKGFKQAILDRLNDFTEAPSLELVLTVLRSRGVIVGVGTGLPEDLFEVIFHHLKWERFQFDFIGIAERIGEGRPHPKMIFDMLEVFPVPHRGFLKVGDTVSDVLEGKNAGVVTAAVLSGTQSEEKLLEAKPDYVIHSLDEVLSLV